MSSFEILATATLQKRKLIWVPLREYSDSFWEESARFPRFTGQKPTWKKKTQCLQPQKKSRIKNGNPKIPAKHTHSLFGGRKGLIEHVCKKLASTPQKQRRLLSFYAENVCNLRRCLMLLSFVLDQLWALDMTWYWPYAVRSSNICSKRFTDMTWSTRNRLIQKEKWTKMFTPTETPDHY